MILPAKDMRPGWEKAKNRLYWNNSGDIKITMALAEDILIDRKS